MSGKQRMVVTAFLFMAASESHSFLWADLVTVPDATFMEQAGNNSLFVPGTVSDDRIFEDFQAVASAATSASPSSVGGTSTISPMADANSDHDIARASVTYFFAVNGPQSAIPGTNAATIIVRTAGETSGDAAAFMEMLLPDRFGGARIVQFFEACSPAPTPSCQSQSDSWDNTFQTGGFPGDVFRIDLFAEANGTGQAVADPTIELAPASVAAGYSLTFSSNLTSLPPTAVPEPRSVFLLAGVLGVMVYRAQRARTMNPKNWICIALLGMCRGFRLPCCYWLAGCGVRRDESAWRRVQRRLAYSYSLRGRTAHQRSRCSSGAVTEGTKGEPK